MRPLGPHHPGSNLPSCIRFSVAFSGSSSHGNFSPMETVISEICREAGAPLTVLMMDMSSGPSSVGEQAFHDKSTLTKPFLFWSHFSPVCQGRASISSSFTGGHLCSPFPQNSELLEPFLTPHVATLNPESLLCELIAINSVWYNFMFLSLLPHALRVHFYPYSPGLCLNKLEKSNSSFGVQHTSTWVTIFYLTFGVKLEV